MRKICIGCGKDVPGPGDENQSGEWCTFGDCEIIDFEGVNRLRRAVIEIQEKQEKKP